MNQKERMLANLPYKAWMDGLEEERIDCKMKTFEYNNTSPDKRTERKELIRKIVGKIGEEFNIESPFQCDYGYNIIMGDNFYSNHNLVILDCAEVTIGNNVFVGPNCGFYTAGHPIDAEQRNSGLEYAKPIKIGSDVWIGGNVCVLPGVTIGDNTVIAAGSVVSEDIPSGTVAAGNPCKPVRKVGEEKK